MAVPMCGIIAAAANAANQARKRREAEEKKRKEEESRHTCTKDIPCKHCFPGCHLKER